MNFKPGNLVRIRRALPFVRCVNLYTADWYDFKSDEVALYLSWGGSKFNGAVHVAHVLIGDVRCAIDENEIELVPVEE
jgi:hypothetical protein